MRLLVQLVAPIVVAILTAVSSGSALAESGATRPPTSVPVAPTLSPHPKGPAKALRVRNMASQRQILSSADEDTRQPAVGRRLRRLKGHEVSPAMMANAQRLVRDYHASPIGTEIPVESAEGTYIARLEVHFHPEGGPVKPWGFHRGISLFAAESE